MSGVANIDLAYQFLKKSKKPITLMEIWNGIKTDVTNNKTDDNESIADLYGEMVLDNRFALSSTGQWTVAENAKVKNIKAEFKTAASLPKKHKGHDINNSDDEDDEDPEIYDSLFVEEEEEETVQIYYGDEDDED